MTGYEQAWLKAFIYTQVIEITIGFAWLRFFMRNQLGKWYTTLFTLFSATALTHPLLWFILPQLMTYLDLQYAYYLAIGEGLVIFLETLWYRFSLFQDRSEREVWLQAFKLSFILNISSWGLGELLITL